MTNDSAGARVLDPRPIHLTRRARLLVIGVLFAVALGVRLYHINEPPLGFHATRQYRSLLIARGYYVDGQASIPAWKSLSLAATRSRLVNQGTRTE